MHASVQQFVKDYYDRSMFSGKRVLEVGSLNVNGSVRPFVERFEPSEYIGTDFLPGVGVDRVVDAVKLAEEFGANSFDTVISTEMLEHAEHWRDCVNNMKAVTKDWLIITTRGPGFKRHSHPHDWWRYTTEDFARIFSDFDTIDLMNDTDPNAPGVFYIGRKSKRKTTDLSSIELEPAPIV